MLRSARTRHAQTERRSGSSALDPCRAGRGSGNGPRVPRRRGGRRVGVERAKACGVAGKRIAGHETPRRAEDGGCQHGFRLGVLSQAGRVGLFLVFPGSCRGDLAAKVAGMPPVEGFRGGSGQADAVLRAVIEHLCTDNRLQRRPVAARQGKEGECRAEESEFAGHGGDFMSKRERRARNLCADHRSRAWAGGDTPAGWSDLAGDAEGSRDRSRARPVRARGGDAGPVRIASRCGDGSCSKERAAGGFRLSALLADKQKASCCQRQRRTWASASWQVGDAFWYHAACRTVACRPGCRRTSNVTTEKRARRNGVERATAGSFH